MPEINEPTRAHTTDLQGGLDAARARLLEAVARCQAAHEALAAANREHTRAAQEASRANQEVANARDTLGRLTLAVAGEQPPPGQATGALEVQQGNVTVIFPSGKMLPG